ncbi:hypothetical protein HYALB_00002352 [Hymenoscyphus albidus]|uniref:J domain-containing protein n=1 Tax=Hymenoscyphus albidus TaxID=595503 RepID=A0A9N9LPI0_9HELO|nr:hypothetical protein HYALB_00002352 [Hymenoscyphus albidus]
MPSKKRKDEGEDLVDEEPPSVVPYDVLGLEKSATADEIKSAYRKAALKHHPDKAPEHLKDEAHTKFQEVAFAYAILSDPVRRKRYDVTGSTSESIDIDGFSWSEYYSEQFRDVITSESIATFSKGYKGSDEEKDDLLSAYTNAKGKWSGIYETVMLSNPLEDEERFREIIDKAIAEKDVEAYTAYTKETAKQKESRMKKARKEAEEAMEYAKELDDEEQVSGKTNDSNSKKKKGGQDDLAALIQQRQAGRGAAFLESLEAKYVKENKKSKGKAGKKGKKRAIDEDEDEDDGMPSEEAFQAAAAKLKQKSEASGGRRSKRAKS